MRVKLNDLFLFPRISMATLDKFSRLIIEAFPTEEKNIWFYSSNHKYHGKLYSTYRTVRNKYIALGATTDSQSISKRSYDD